MSAKGSSDPGRFLDAEWRDLLMLNYEVAPEILRPRVPAGTELDSFEGRFYASLVAFRFANTRVLGCPIPFHRDFEELNLRFYVRRTVGAETRRAVVFVREVVPRRAIAAMARALYNEPYVALPMRSVVQGDPPRVEYAWAQDGRWHTLAGRAQGTGRVPDDGTQEAFITEHYWGCTPRRRGGTFEYRVEHPRWRVWPAVDVQVAADLTGLYGASIAAALAGPASAFIAEGSPVRVYRPTVLDPERRVH